MLKTLQLDSPLGSQSVSQTAITFLSYFHVTPSCPPAARAFLLSLKFPPHPRIPPQGFPLLSQTVPSQVTPTITSLQLLCSLTALRDDWNSGVCLWAYGLLPLIRDDTTAAPPLWHTPNTSRMLGQE